MGAKLTYHVKDEQNPYCTKGEVWDLKFTNESLACAAQDYHCGFRYKKEENGDCTALPPGGSKMKYKDDYLIYKRFSNLS